MTPATSPILVVDDSESSRYAKVRMLQRAGFDVVEADSGERAMALLRTHKPRLVVLDVNLPDIHGFELCRRIKHSNDTASTVVLQVSATYVEHSDTVRALESGADASLVEPIDATVLVATVRALLRGRQAEDALRHALALEQQARAVAEAANRMKDEFLATLSHELRTPLGAILTWATLLRSGGNEFDLTKRGLEAIERNTRLQVKLIEDLLDVSRIISGKMQLEIVPVDLKAVIGSAVEAIAPAALAKDIKLRAHIGPDLPAIEADPARLQQIASNLLSNGVKFTSPGGRTDISVTVDAGWIEIRVSDTGRGIAAEFLPHVFERFQQADSSTTRAESGLGLGLAIVRHLVLAHRGTVEAASEGLGRGAVFTVRLPVVQARTPVELPFTLPQVGHVDAGPALRDQLDGVRVLVVEDDADSREAILAVLSQAGAVLASADNVRRALEHLSREPVDVVVSDIGMPHEDGFMLIRELRSRLLPGAAPVGAIALTAFASVEDQHRAFVAGYDAFLAKPADMNELVSVIGQLARRSAVRGDAAGT
jgi:signal transduction histidine kinase